MFSNKKASKKGWIPWGVIFIIVITIIAQLYFSIKSQVKLLYWDKLQTQIIDEHPEIVKFEYKAKIPQLIMPSYSATVYVDAKIDGKLTPELEEAIKNETVSFLTQFIYRTEHKEPKVLLIEDELIAQDREFSTKTSRIINGINLKITVSFENADSKIEKLTIKGVLRSEGVDWEGDNPNLSEKYFDF